MTIWVLLAGLPGTGKSTLARALASRLPAVTLDLDRVRGALFPGPATDYSPRQKDLCMRAVLQAAAYLTARQRTPYLLFDGRTYSRSEQIEQVLAAAAQARAETRILHLTCSDEAAAQRLAQPEPGHPARDRDLALYHRLRQSFAPIRHPHLALDTTPGIEPILAAALAYLAPGAIPELAGN